MSVTEQELADAAVAPRVTDEAVESNIVSEHFFTAWDGVQHAERGKSFSEAEQTDVTPLKLLTFCVLVLKNGFTVTGESACASPENFNPEIGQRLARQQAKNKIWAFMGYELRTKLNN